MQGDYNIFAISQKCNPSASFSMKNNINCYVEHAMEHLITMDHVVTDKSFCAIDVAYDRQI